MKYLEMAPLYKSALFSKVWNYNCSNIAKSCRNIALVFLLRTDSDSLVQGVVKYKEDVTWSVLHGGGWSKTHRITRGRVGAELAPSSTMKNAPCHIPLTLFI